ncbi:MAG: magnesium transporter [Candidatus Aenigmatarchaeota archaeon]
MGFFDKDFREILSSQTVSVIIGLVAGTILALYTDQILLIPGMLIILPGFLEMRGNISGSFACRLSSGLFLGVVNPDKLNTRLTRGNMIASFAMVLVLTSVIGILAFIFTYMAFNIIVIKLLLLPVIAGVIANAIEIPLTLFMTFYLFRKGHDPNNIMGTIVTSTGDITSIISLLVAILVMT